MERKVHLFMLMVQKPDTETLNILKLKELDLLSLCHKLAYGHHTVVERIGHFDQYLPPQVILSAVSVGS